MKLSSKLILDHANANPEGGEKLFNEVFSFQEQLESYAGFPKLLKVAEAAAESHKFSNNSEVQNKVATLEKRIGVSKRDYHEGHLTLMPSRTQEITAQIRELESSSSWGTFVVLGLGAIAAGTAFHTAKLQRELILLQERREVSKMYRRESSK